MKISTWLMSGAGALFFVGVVGLALGILRPGEIEPVEALGGGGRSAVAEFKQKAALSVAALAKKSGKKDLAVEEWKGHRVFVSRSIVFLPKENEPVQPLNEKQITEDGIEVGWKMKYGFSPEDREVADQDEDQDGFTNKEEYDKKTDPKDPMSSPSKWVKLKITSVDPAKLMIGFSGKSEGRYTIRLKLGVKPKDVDVVVGDKIWVLAGDKAVEVLRSEEEAKARTGRTNSCPHAIPLMVKEYKDDKGKRMDEKTKTENEYDDSMLVLQRMDELAGPINILVDERGKARGVEWSVGDIRLISLVPGEGEMGPYRVGQSFTYAGKVFVVREATTLKVSLKMMPEGETIYILPNTTPTLLPKIP
ncbi:MAG: Amuc_1099 family pilus-like system protein [Aliarcobacter sp.]